MRRQRTAANNDRGRRQAFSATETESSRFRHRADDLYSLPPREFGKRLAQEALKKLDKLQKEK
jgi:hypothetical protein